MLSRRLALASVACDAAEVRDDFAVAHTAGFDAVEIADAKLQRYLTRGGTVTAFRAALTRTGLAPVSLLFGPDELRLEAAVPLGAEGVIDRCRAACARAAAIGCPTVSAVPAPRADCPDDDALQERAVETLHAMGAVAREHGVRIGLELVGLCNAPIRTLAAARALLDRVAHPAVGLILDAFHFHAGGSTWAMLEKLDPGALGLVRLADAPALPPGRLSEADRLLPGDGVMPLLTLVRLLERAGYAGSYSIKVSWPAYRGWRPAALARAAWESLGALFAELDEVEGRLD